MSAPKRTFPSRNLQPVNYKDDRSDTSCDDINNILPKKGKYLKDSEFEVTGEDVNSGSNSSSDEDCGKDDGRNNKFTNNDEVVVVSSSDDESEKFSGAPWENPKLSDYEKMVLKNIDARNKFMIENGFPEAVRDLTTCLPSKPTKPKKQPAKKNVIQKKGKPTPVREPSRRIRNLVAKKEEEVKQEVEEEEEKENVELVDNRLLDSADMGEDMNGIMNHISDSAVYNPNLNLADCSLVEYRNQLLSVPLLRVRKVLPGRIQSMLTHPQTSKTIMFAGDKYGNFGVWAPLEGEGEPTVHRVHRAPLNCISVAKEDRSKVYTTGHDGAIVQMDFGAGKFINVFATDWSERITHLTWHDEFENHKFLVAHGRGDVGILDLRAGKEMQKWISSFQRSVRTVQHHPVQENYFLASSGTGSLKIFDLRNSDNSVCEIEHDKGLTSAFFSPGGTRIVTTCNDDHVRVFDSSVLTSKINKIASYLHNNFTGRWLTSFKAKWVPQRDDVFHVGSLLKPRRMQFYKADNSGILCDVFNDEVETVCCVITMHPTLPVFTGANSSGKAHMFGPSDLLDKATS